MSKTNKDGYLLLFRGAAWYNELPAEKVQQVVNDANAWIQRIIDQGKCKGGQPLELEGAIVQAKTGRVIADGPFAESKELIGGYLILTVDTLEEAIAIAQECPSMRQGTTIEVRPIAPECPLQRRVREAQQQLETATA